MYTRRKKSVSYRASQSDSSSDDNANVDGNTGKRKSSQKKPSVPKTQTKRRRSSAGVAGPSSQSSKNPDSELVKNLAQKCVYFLLIEERKKYSIKKKAITTYVFEDETCSANLYKLVITKANSILKKVYGMEIMELENQKDSYLIINILKNDQSMADFIELPQVKHQQYGLILYLLTIIFMNENRITETELWKALKPLGLDPLSKKGHPIFGDVKRLVTSELVKQMYLTYECISKEPIEHELKWGLRAKEEVDKRDLLQFVCQIMDETTPEMWILQHKDAEESARVK